MHHPGHANVVRVSISAVAIAGISSRLIGFQGSSSPAEACAWRIRFSGDREFLAADEIAVGDRLLRGRSRRQTPA